MRVALGVWAGAGERGADAWLSREKRKRPRSAAAGRVSGHGGRKAISVPIRSFPGPPALRAPPPCSPRLTPWIARRQRPFVEPRWTHYRRRRNRGDWTGQGQPRFQCRLGQAKRRPNTKQRATRGVGSSLRSIQPTRCALDPAVLGVRPGGSDTHAAYFSRCGIGSTGLAPWRSSKCSCGWSTVPVLPALAITWPRRTTSSRLTSTWSAWA
jgi:hypothetical protein